jgi:hypothetical protein
LKIIVTFLSLLLASTVAFCQVQRGVVVDADSSKPVYPATIANITSGMSYITDEQGAFAIPARNGDVLAFSAIGFHSTRKTAATSKFLTVEMASLSIKMKEFVLHSGYTQFQQDSAVLATLYDKELNTKPIKTGFSSANGGGITGLIGGPVQKISKSYRQNKRFKENFESDMEQRFIDTRYTKTLVATLTKLHGDSVTDFMNAYPMDYPFARAATELELKMWVRHNFKEYSKAKPTHK